MARREKEVAGGLVRKDKRSAKKNSERGGKEGKGKKPRSGSAKAGRRKVYQNRGESPKPKKAQPATVEVKQYIEGGVHALLSLPKGTREVHCIVPDRNGNKAEFSAIGGGFNTGKLDEKGQPIIIEFVEIRLVSTEVGNPLHALPESAKEIFITPAQVTVEEFERKPNWTDAVYEVRLVLREYLSEARKYSAPAPIYVSQFTRSEREVPAILKPAPVTEPKLVPASQMAALEAMKHQLSEEAIRKDASRNISAFMAGDLGKYVFAGVYVELKQAGRDVRVTLLCVDEGTPMFDELGAFRNIGFSFSQLQGSAELPLIFREGQEPQQVAVRTFHAKLQNFLVTYGFKVHETAEEPRVNGNGNGRPKTAEEIRCEQISSFEFEGVSLKAKMVKGMRGEVAAVHVIAVPEEHEAADELRLVAEKKLYIPVYLVEKFSMYPREKVRRPADELDGLEQLFKLLRRAFGLEVNQVTDQNLLAEVASMGKERRLLAPQFGK